MKDTRALLPVGRGIDSVADRLLARTLPRCDRTELIMATQALGRRQFEPAERHLRRALDIDAESAEARSLMGVLHERLGEHHAAYECYKLALQIDRHDPIARAGMGRYCERFGLDPDNKSINPAAK